MHRIILLIISFLLWLPVYAQDTTFNANYFLTTDVWPQKPGELLLDFAFLRQEGHDETDTIFPTFFSYGLNDKWLLYGYFETLVIHQSDEGSQSRGIGDSSLGLKYSFLNTPRKDDHFALLFNIIFPTGDVDKDVTEGFMRYEPSFIASTSFKIREVVFELMGQFGFSFAQRMQSHEDPGKDDPSAHEVILNLAYGINDAKKTYNLEINWVNDEWNHGGEDNELYLTPGFFYKFNDNFEFGIALAKGLTRDSDKYQFFLVFQFIIDTLNNDKDKDKDKDKNKDKDKDKDKNSLAGKKNLTQHLFKKSK